MATAFPPSTFNWVDLHVKDVDAALDFYQELFGWDFEAASQMFGGAFNLARLDGKLVCGVGPLPPTQAALGMPAHWNTYIAVESADAAAVKTKELGGIVLLPPMEVARFGRMIAIQDPDGAVVALWEARNLAGFELSKVPNTHAWNELCTRKLEASATFYEQLLGWTTSEAPPSPGPRMRTVSLGGPPIGTMLEIPAQWGPEMPANWAVHFAVESCDGTLETAQRLGATVVTPPMDLPNVGRFAGLRDPQGAHLMVVQRPAG